MLLHNPLNPATGVEDATMLPWTSGNPATGVDGSFPPLGVFTDPQAEIVNVITGAGIPPAPTPTQLLQAILALIGAEIAAIPAAAITPYGATAEGGLAKDASNNFLLSFANLAAGAMALTDLFAGSKAGNPYSYTGAQLVAFVAANLPSEAGSITTVDLAAESVTAFRSFSDGTSYAGTGGTQQILSYTFTLPEAANGIILYSAQWYYEAGQQSGYTYLYLDGNLVATGGGTAPSYQEFINLFGAAYFSAGSHTVTVTQNRPSNCETNGQQVDVFVGAR